MATFTIVDEFFKHLGDGTHALGSHSFKIGLTNTLPVQTTCAVWADITEISTGFGYSAGGPTIDGESWAETGSGTGIWMFNSTPDEVITASGGSIGPFRYVVLYNDTPTSPADPVIGFVDYGSSITVTTGNTFTVDVGANGWFRLGRGTLS